MYNKVINYLKDLVNLTKPKLASLVSLTVAVGAISSPDKILISNLILTIVGVHLVIMGTGVFNCLIEKDDDAKMERTKNRPIPAGRVSPVKAFIFGIILTSFGLSILFFKINTMSFLLTFLASFLYLLVYTPLKKKGSSAVFIGSISGALPPVIGWVSVTQELGLMAILLFSIVFVWQIPHTTAIYIYRRKDYNNAGMILCQTGKDDFKSSGFEILLYTILLIIIASMPVVLGISSIYYTYFSSIVGALFLGLAFKGFSLKERSDEQKRWARKYFLGSIIYLPIIFLGLAL